MAIAGVKPLPKSDCKRQNRKIMINTIYRKISYVINQGKGKAIPLQTLTGPEVFQEFEAPRF
jgi:hypothetical protein